MGEANIWQPRTLLDLSADTKRITEKFTAVASQTLFTLADFTYVVGTGALQIFKNGVYMVPNVDFVEGTTSTFSLIVGASAADVVVAVGYAGITGAADVRDTDIFLANYQALRDYAGTETTIYVQGTVTAGDNGQAFFQKFTGAVVGTYVDDGIGTIRPTGGDGSIGWTKSIRQYYPTLTGEVGVTDNYYVVGRAERYGVVGDSDGTSGTGTDDTDAIRNMGLSIQALGGGEPDFGSLVMRVLIDDTDTAPLFTLTGLDGVRFKSAGAKFVVDRDFPTTGLPKDTAYIFRIRSCKNVHSEVFSGSCPGTRGTIYEGAILFDLDSVGIVGTTNFTSESTDITDFFMTHWIHGTAGAADANRSKNIDLGIVKSYNCGYGVNPSNSGDNLRAAIVAELTGRSFICHNVRNIDINVTSKDHQASADVIMATDTGLGIDGAKIVYNNTEGTVAAAGTKDCVVVEFQDGDIQAGTHRNIDIKLNIKSTIGAYRSDGFMMRKLLQSGAVDTVDRGHVLENLTVSGVIESGGGSQGTIAFGSTYWGNGDTITGLRFKDLIMTGGQPAIFPYGALKDIMYLENVSYPTTVNIETNTSYKTVLIGCTAQNFTSATTEDSLVDYIGCNITSGATQAKSDKNKNFISTFVGAILYGRSGVYTPTLTDGANVTSSTAYECRYEVSNGGVVSVSGRVDVAPTVTLTATNLEISLPLAKILGNQHELSGSGSNVVSESAALYADTANNTAGLQYKPVGTSAESVNFQFTYAL